MTGYPQNQMNLRQPSTPFIGTSNYNQPYNAQAGTTIPVDQLNDDLENAQQQQQQQQQPQQQQGQLYHPGQQGAVVGQQQSAALYNPYNDQNNMMALPPQPQYAVVRRGFGGYLNMQGQDITGVPNYDQNYLSQINNNYPGVSARHLMGPPQQLVAGAVTAQPQSAYFPIQQPQLAYHTGQDPSLIGFQAVKLIRRIWGTPYGARKSGAQLLQCRQTCGGKAICKPVSCIVTSKCPRSKRCTPPPPPSYQSCRAQPQPQCQPECPQCCCRCSRVKPCQCRVTPSCQPQPRRQCFVKCTDPCHQTQESLSVTASQHQLLLQEQQLEQQVQAICATHQIQQQQQQCKQDSTIAKQFTDTGVGCSCSDDGYLSASMARRESSRNFSVRESRDFGRDRRSPPPPPQQQQHRQRDDDCCYDDYDHGGGGLRGGGMRGCYYDNNNCNRDYDDDDDYRFRCRPKSCDNYVANDPCRQSASCDSCESFERWREKCECRKKEREREEREAEKKAAVDTKDGQNDPKPVDQATSESSDDKLGHKAGKSVSVNTSKTKIPKSSKSKLKTSKSDGSVKSKGKKGKKAAKDKISMATMGGGGSKGGKKDKGGKKNKKK